MATTTYFSITVPGEGSQDWVTALNRALSAITEKMVVLQRPTGVTLQWGDVAAVKYIVCDSDGVRILGGLNTALYPTRNFVIEGGADFPADYAENSLFVKDFVVYARLDGAWVALGAVTAEAVATAGGILVEDLGSSVGSFAVSDGAGAIASMGPGANLELLVGDDTSPSGWALQSWLGLAGFSLSQGHIPVGLTGDGAESFAPSATLGDMLVSAPLEAAGLKWESISARVATLVPSRGQILAGGASGPVAVPVAAANDYVPISDATQTSGIRWVSQTSLGAVPNIRTRVAGDLFLHANYI